MGIKSYSRTSMLILLLFFIGRNTSAQIIKKGFTNHHVHLQDEASRQLGYRMMKAFGEVPGRTDSLLLNADSLIQRLDRAHFNNAWIISNAYWFGSPFVTEENEDRSVSEQNDWIAAQAALYPDRLEAFMSINPLRSYAAEEVARCINTRRYSGIKMHFANSKVDILDTLQLKKVQEIIDLANKAHLIILLHLRNAELWDGKATATVFLKEILPHADQTTVVLAHMGGWGNFDQPTQEAYSILAHHVQTADKKGGSLFFDISAVLSTKNKSTQKDAADRQAAELKAFANMVQTFGTDHLLFGTDWPLYEIEEYRKSLERILGVVHTNKILQNNLPHHASAK